MGSSAGGPTAAAARGTTGHQRWRAPLREGARLARASRSTPCYEARASAHLKDPWAARDAYIDVVLDRSPERLEAFLAAHARAPLDAAAGIETRKLLEMQRQRMLMHTSCGWFFDEISALEPVQVLRYAALGLEYLADLGGGRLEDELLRRLAAAPSNLPSTATGPGSGARLVADGGGLRRVIAHYAMSGRLRGPAGRGARVRVGGSHASTKRARRRTARRFRVARVRLQSEVTGETREAVYALVHYGGPRLLLRDPPVGERGGLRGDEGRPPPPLAGALRRRHGPRHGRAFPWRALLAGPTSSSRSGGACSPRSSTPSSRSRRRPTADLG